jgi:pimeloyl-ACP methyl ester carboxylesterase
VGIPIRSPRFRAVATAMTAVLLLGAVACDQSAAVRGEALADSRPVTFRSRDGVRLSGRLFGPDDATAGVVLAHMLPADQTSWFDFAQRLGTMGYRALTFDFRGYCPGGDAGCSSGERDVAAIWQDVLGAVDEVRSGGVSRIALVGASMGGTAALVATSQDPEGVQAIVTLSAASSIEGLSADLNVLQTITAAKLFVAGSTDTVAAESAQTFFDTSLQPKRVELLTTSDHGTDLLEGNQAEQTRTAILGWLERYLPVAAPSRNP